MSNIIKIKIPHLELISEKILRRDFEFVVGGRVVACDRVVSNIVSPAVAKIHETDPTFSSFKIDVDQSSVEDKRFLESFASLVRGKSIKVSSKEIGEYLSLFRLLGNTNIVDMIESQFKGETTIDNVCHKLESVSNSVKGGSEFTANDESVLEFAASNFFSIIDSINFDLDVSVIDGIISSPSLVVRSESSLFRFVRSVISAQGNSARFLLGHVCISNLTTDELRDFLDLVEESDFSWSIWQKIRCFILHGDERPQSESKSVSLPFVADHYDGIFNYLNEESGGNCIMNGVVSVESSPLYSYGALDSLINYSGNKNARSYCFKDKEGGFLKFDFNDKRVQLTNYTLHTPKADLYHDYRNSTSWKIEGSNDGNKWTLIDSRKNDFSLIPHDSSHVYKCNKSTSSAFRYIRITDTNERGRVDPEYNNLFISSIEFFGSLITN